MINEKGTYQPFPTDARSLIQIIRQCADLVSCNKCPAEHTIECVTGRCFDKALDKIKTMLVVPDKREA